MAQAFAASICLPYVYYRETGAFRPVGASMKRCYSLKRKKEFRYTYRTGKSVSARPLAMTYARRRADETRFGFSISKKIGNAVCRNRVKRRLREALTPLIPAIKTGYNIVFIAREAILDESFSGIGDTMRSMLHKAGLLREMQQ